ncbi:MAG: hypothetical protein HYR94_01790 [Chloroflexi bacterium]|nr:hypothetical protein [Chloroflexota bacterium]
MRRPICGASWAEQVEQVSHIFCQSNLLKLVQALTLAIIGFGGYAGHVALAADPVVSVQAPSHEIGDVGAALGNVWDMSSLNDIAWTQPDGRNQTVQYTLYQAGDLGVPPGAFGYVLRGAVPKGSDLASAFYTNSSVSIPSQIYRYLIYRAYIAPHQPDEAGIQLTNARLLYSSQWGLNWQVEAFPFRRYSKPQRLECPPPKTAYGGWCNFFVDLTQDLYVAGGPNPWDWGQPGATIEAFGLWPHENWCNSICAPSGDSPDYFFLDFVYLTGEIVAKSPDYNYTVRWYVADADGGQLTSNLYYQEQEEIRLPSESPACNASNLATTWIPIPGGTTTISSPSSPYQFFLPVIAQSLSSNTSFGSGIIGFHNQTFDWNLASGAYVEGKVYYICVVVEDSDAHKSYQVSSAPVIKAPPATVFNPNNLTISSR